VSAGDHGTPVVAIDDIDFHVNLLDYVINLTYRCIILRKAGKLFCLCSGQAGRRPCLSKERGVPKREGGIAKAFSFCSPAN
jgi:hypothetical protein